MVEEDNLSVLFALNSFASGTISGVGDVRVHVNHFAVTEVSELEAELGVGNRPEVGRVIQVSSCRVPVEEAEVTGSRI